MLGYTGEIAVSDDHLIVAQRVTQNVTDNASLAADAGRGRAALRRAAGRGSGRQRLLLHRQPGT